MPAASGCLSDPPSSPATGWSDAEREVKRAALRHVLDAAVAGNKAGLFYYQGLHDIAAVLLFVCGELPACRLLRALAEGHLRDCTRPDLAAATETLRLLYPILEQVGWPGGRAAAYCTNYMCRGTSTRTMLLCCRNIAEAITHGGLPFHEQQSRALTGLQYLILTVHWHLPGTAASVCLPARSATQSCTAI